MVALESVVSSDENAELENILEEWTKFRVKPKSTTAMVRVVEPRLE